MAPVASTAWALPQKPFLISRLLSAYSVLEAVQAVMNVGPAVCELTLSLGGRREVMMPMCDGKL